MLILIELDFLTLENLSYINVLLVPHSSLGNIRNKTQCQGPLLNLNIKLWAPSHLNYNGLIIFLTDLCITLSHPSSIYRARKLFIYLAHNPTLYKIDIEFHVILEKIQNKPIHLLPISSSNQLTGAFTKLLSLQIFPCRVYMIP